jgi:hypothetical protein
MVVVTGGQEGRRQAERSAVRGDRETERVALEGNRPLEIGYAQWTWPICTARSAT